MLSARWNSRTLYPLWQQNYMKKQNKKIPAYFIVLFLVFLKSYQLLFVAVLQIFLVLSFWTYKRTVFLLFCDWVRRCDLFWTMSCNKSDIVSHSRFPYWCGRLRSSLFPFPMVTSKVQGGDSSWWWGGSEQPCWPAWARSKLWLFWAMEILGFFVATGLEITLTVGQVTDQPWRMQLQA